MRKPIRPTSPQTKTKPRSSKTQRPKARDRAPRASRIARGRFGTRVGYRLFTPGPVDVPDYILGELAAGLVYHREQAFAKLADSVRRGLQRLMMTQNSVYVLTSSGTGAMEAAVANLVSPGDKVLVAISGRFGERWRELAIRFGGYVDVLSVPYGESIPPVEVERHLLATDTVKCVFTTLTETSTGAVNDIKGFGEVCRRLNRILVVDAVAGLGADELRVDDWNVDVVVGGSQKALAVPPGLAFIGVGERAWELIQKSRGARYYFDLKAYRRYAEKGQTPWTPAISLYYALDEALARVTKKGTVSYWNVHKQNAQLVRKQVARLGLDLFPKKPSNALTVIKMPESVDGARLVELCKTRDGILFANGQGNLRGLIVRIGHMGPIPRPFLEKALRSFRRRFLEVAGRAR